VPRDILPTHISVDDSPLLIHLGLVVVIYTESAEQDLILVFGQRALELEFGFGRALPTSLHHVPECCIVEIVDVACQRCQWNSCRFMQKTSRTKHEYAIHVDEESEQGGSYSPLASI